MASPYIAGPCRTLPGMVEKSARLELRVTPELLGAIDAARGDVSRTRWVERALERALGLDGPTQYSREWLRRNAERPEISPPLSDAIPLPEFAGVPESQQPSGYRPPVEPAKRSAPVPRLAARQGKGVFTPRPKGKS